MNIKGIKVDKVTIDQAVDQVIEWVEKGGKHYVVTPNIEMVMSAAEDSEFRKVLNEADLAIPDSARFGWADAVLSTKNPLERLYIWPMFLFPKFFDFPVTTGTDLMERLLKVSAEKGFKISLLGGRGKVAEKVKERYLRMYPNLNVVFAESGGEIDSDGKMNGSVSSKSHMISGEDKNSQSTKYQIPNTDIMFVAFGHGKQEKWISKNLKESSVKVMIGVGGAFDYLSGDVSRAPKWMRNLGLEWLYRVINQPWRIKRFGSIVKFALSTLKS